MHFVTVYFVAVFGDLIQWKRFIFFFSYKRKTFLFQPVCVCVCVTVCLCVCVCECELSPLSFGMFVGIFWHFRSNVLICARRRRRRRRCRCRRLSLARIVLLDFLFAFGFAFLHPHTDKRTYRERERERECDSREVFGDKISSLAKFALCLQIILDFTISFSPCLSIYFSPSLSLPVYLLLFLCLLCLFFNSNPLAKTITRYKVNNNNNNNTSHNINNNNTNNVRVRHCNAQWGKCRKNLSANRQILIEWIY